MHFVRKDFKSRRLQQNFNVCVCVCECVCVFLSIKLFINAINVNFSKVLCMSERDFVKN